MTDIFASYIPKYSVRGSYIYTLPNPNLLKDYAKDNNPDASKLEAMMTNIKEIFKTFQVNLISNGYIVGANVILFQYEPTVGTKLSKVKGLEEDLALYLGVEGVRILAPIKGKPLIGVEVPNDTSNIVGLKSLLLSDEFENNTMELPIVLGQTLDTPYMFDLTKMPHLLVAGQTGSGKSIAVHTMLTSLLMSKHPSEMKLVLIDVKKVELAPYNVIEKYFKPNFTKKLVFTETDEAMKALHSVVTEMDRRYNLLKIAKCRNIKEYNDKIISGELTRTDEQQHLPYVVVMIDEYAELVLSTGKVMEGYLTKLGNLSRAVGIHMIICTQRPSVNIVSGTIKANFPVRIAYKVFSGMDSKVILDGSGAQYLIGKGDCLMLDTNNLNRIQTAYIDTDEVEKIVNYIATQ